MKLLQYIRYFFYVGTNWNWYVAIVLLQQEIKGEKKYGINTTGADELKKLKRKGIDISHATLYMPVSYQLLEEALGQIPESNRKHFFDIGCGKGRAMCVAAHYGFKTVSGIDFSKEFCEAALQNLQATKQKIPSVNFEAAEADAAVAGIPNGADCIFLFNPFDETVMKKAAQHIQASISQKPRKAHIIYANPLYKNLFLANGFKEKYHSKKLRYFEISILVNG